MADDTRKLQLQIESLLNQNHILDDAIAQFDKAGTSTYDLKEKKAANTNRINELMSLKIKAFTTNTKKTKGAK